MPTITINIAGIGTPLSDGTNSKTGHMWFTLDDGKGGPPVSRGFAPDKPHEGQPFAPGEVHRDDNTTYLATDYSRTIAITQAQSCKADSPSGNPPQLQLAVIGVVRVWRFAGAKPPYSSG